VKLSHRTNGLKFSQAMSGIKGEVEANDLETGKVLETVVAGFCSTMTWTEKILMPL
jgi:hypothetical protein